MPLKPPNLDDRTYEQLVQAAISRVQSSCPEWTDLTEHDPGRVLLEAFSHLTEVMLYRLNRLPDKAYVALLNLLGVQQRPPYAAMAEITLQRANPAQGVLRVPAGTEVSTERTGGDDEPPVFVLAEDVVLEDGQQDSVARFFHAEHVKWRLVGHGLGEPGLELNMPRAPLVGNAPLPVKVAVELTPEELAVGGDRFLDLVKLEGHTCAVWREVDRFIRSDGPAAQVFEVDRLDGRLRFAPAVQRVEADGRLSPVPEALAAIPARGRAIFAEYWCGGGTTGNVPARSLTRIKRAAPGLKGVVNLAAAAGGRAAESLDNTLRRAPVEVFSLERAVTKLDYEIVSQRVGGVSRAKAFTGVHLWPHERPGGVVVLLVPEGKLQVGQDMLTQILAWQQQIPGQGDGGAVLGEVQQQLTGRQPLGATVKASWARYKQVRVSARVTANPSENPEEVKRRVLERLHRTISPLPYGEKAWPFGRALRISDVYEMLLSDPGVRYAEDVRLLVDEVPDGEVSCIAADPHLWGFWFAGSGPNLFRSQNDGESWENIALARALPDGLQAIEVRAVVPHPEPQHAGLVAVAVNARQGDKRVAAVLVSDETGERWQHWFTVSPGQNERGVEARDLAWIDRGGRPVLLVATTHGLYARTWGVRAGAELMPIANDPNRACESVSALRMPEGSTLVSVALLLHAGQPQTDVFLATLNPDPGQGEPDPSAMKRDLGGAFTSLGVAGANNFRVVRIQRVLSRAYVWLGFAIPGRENRHAVKRAELAVGAGGAFGVNGAWKDYGQEYGAGTCFDFGFLDGQVWAATSRKGLLVADHPSPADPVWKAYGGPRGLPTKDDGDGLHDVLAVATREASGHDPWSPGRSVVMAGGPKGLLRGRGEDPQFESRAARRVETVSLPPSGLFCSGDHDIEVVRSDEQD